MSYVGEDQIDDSRPVIPPTPEDLGEVPKKKPEQEKKPRKWSLLRIFRKRKLRRRKL